MPNITRTLAEINGDPNMIRNFLAENFISREITEEPDAFSLTERRTVKQFLFAPGISGTGAGNESPGGAGTLLTAAGQGNTATKRAWYDEIQINHIASEGGRTHLNLDAALAFHGELKDGICTQHDGTRPELGPAKKPKNG